MLWYFYSNISFNISPDFCSTFFCNKTSKTAYVNVLTMGQTVFYFFKHGF
ncbi:hypothetical protein GALL_63540 [mine drainage metagenome]|uniref:Uncharacterized protein n=1 Tax=mine drainage metagenome TaxID=410659 RepID=A0A1J5SUF1_9ZZZZ